MDRLKRAFSITLMVVTVLSMSLITAPVASAQSAEAGDLIKIEGYAPVYYLGADGQRYVFPNEDTFFSWYEDFSSVVTLPQEEVESYDLAANVTMRPGTKLIKRPVPTDPKVYAVTPDAELVWIPDEATALALYGENWSDRIVDVPDSFFVDYDKTDAEASADTYPAGTLVQPSGSSDIYYINGEGEAQMIDDEAAFEANRFQWGYVTQAGEDYELPAEGDVITGAVDTVIDTSQGGGAGDGSGDDEPAAGSGLTVALSNNTPGSASIPEKASGVEFTTYNLTASNDGDVTLDNVTVTRKGVGQANDIDKVYLYQGNERLTVGRTVNSSDNTVMFTNVGLEISAGQTETMSIVADIADLNASGNHAFSIEEASDLETSGGTTVSGSFPLQGNVMSISSGVSAATLTVTSNNGTSNVNVKIGQDDQEIADINLSNDNNEDVELSEITLTNGGNALADNLGNLALYYDGSEVAEGTLANNKMAFELDEAITIEKGDNIDLKVRADIEGGDSNTIKLYLGYAADVAAMGQTYGFNANVSYDAFNSSSEAYPLAIQGSEVTVNYATNNTETVVKDQTNYVFETLEVSVEEEITVTEMRARIVEGDGSSDGVVDITNLEIRNPDTGEIISGTEVSGTGDLDTATSGDPVVWKFENFTWTGSSEWEIRGDIPNNAGSGDSYQVDINFSDLVARYTSSNNEVDYSSDLSQSTLTGKAITIGASTLTVTAGSFNNGEAVTDTDNVVIAGGLLEANSVSAITVSAMEFEGANGSGEGTSTDANAYFASNNVKQVKLLIDGEEVDSVSSGSLTEGEVTFDNFEVDVPSNGTVEFQVVVNISSSLVDGSSDSMRVQLRSVTAKDINNDTAATQENGESATISDSEKVDFGRQITIYESGELTLTMDNTVDPVDSTQYILAGSEGNKVVRFKIKADYEDIKVTKLMAVTDDGLSARSVSGAHITDEDGNVLASDVMISTGVSASSTVTFEDDNGLFTVEEGTHYYYLTLDLKSMGDGATETAASDDSFTIYFTDLEGQGLSGNDVTYGSGVSYGSGSTESATGNQAKVVGVQITSITDQTSAGFSSGETTVFKFDVTTADSDNASSTGDTLKAELRNLNVLFTYTTDTATGSEIKLYRQGKTGYATTSLPSSESEASFDLTGTSTSADWSASNYEINQGETATFYIKATVQDANSNTADYVQCKIQDLTSGGDVTWYDGATEYTDLRLNYTEVVGTSVSQ